MYENSKPNSYLSNVYKNLLKPIFDRIIAGLVFLLILPLFILIVILLIIVNKENPFFLQKRPGKNESVFTIIKFKTMNNGTDKKGNLLPDSKRLTRIGKIIRKTSLDELPQLINIIKGDMSFIGPRPLLVEYLPLYNNFQKQRHSVRPGITGWAQVNGRNSLNWNEKFEYDIFYVQKISFLLDVRIVLKTISKVFLGKDINKLGEATMHRFKGN